MFKLVLQNLMGYDLIILVIALFNGLIIYPKANKSSTLLTEHLQPKTYIPITLLLERVKSNAHNKLDLNAMKHMRSEELKYYNIFDAINHAFPMLGMLGTILALLSMLNLATDQIVLQFTSALTSTFWGLVCALVFKGFDAVLRTKVEQNEENLKLILERIDSYPISEAEYETL